MSWQKITRPLTMEIDPEIVRIGKICQDRFEGENRPEGFAMFHATRGSEGGLNDTRIVYLSPVAAEYCRELLGDYTLEACDAPARDEPNMVYVFGDPRAMSLLKKQYEPTDEERVWIEAQKAQIINYLSNDPLGS